MRLPRVEHDRREIERASYPAASATRARMRGKDMLHSCWSCCSFSRPVGRVFSAAVAERRLTRGPMWASFSSFARASSTFLFVSACRCCGKRQPGSTTAVDAVNTLRWLGRKQPEQRKRVAHVSRGLLRDDLAFPSQRFEHLRLLRKEPLGALELLLKAADLLMAGTTGGGNRVSRSSVSSLFFAGGTDGSNSIAFLRQM